MRLGEFCEIGPQGFVFLLEFLMILHYLIGIVTIVASIRVMVSSHFSRRAWHSFSCICRHVCLVLVGALFGLLVVVLWEILQRLMAQSSQIPIYCRWSRYISWIHWPKSANPRQEHARTGTSTRDLALMLSLLLGACSIVGGLRQGLGGVARLTRCGFQLLFCFFASCGDGLIRITRSPLVSSWHMHCRVYQDVDGDHGNCVWWISDRFYRSHIACWCHVEKIPKSNRSRSEEACVSDNRHSVAVFSTSGGGDPGWLCTWWCSLSTVSHFPRWIA
jgi:hypothetical protein